MSKVKHLESIQEVTGDSVNIKASHEVDKEEEVNRFSFGFKELIVYALGVGASTSVEDELRFLYESHNLFKAFPTFFTIPGIICCMRNPKIISAIPGKTVGLENSYGEHYLEVLGNLPTKGVLESKCQVVEVLDKGFRAVVVVEVESFNKGELIVRNQFVFNFVGAGGFGGARTGTKIIPCDRKPSRAPDAVSLQKTGVDQAALYRLSADVNPIHIDPLISKIYGFNRPILHGQCALGYSARHVLRKFANNDPNLFKSIKARFIKSSLPGQTLKIKMWRNGNRIHFETSVVETNKIIIAGAYIDLKSIKMRPTTRYCATDNLQSDAIFEMIVARVKAEPSKAKAINAVYLYNITKNGKQVKQWTMDLKNASIYEGAPKTGKANTTLTVSDDDFVQMALGKLNPQAAFMKGKLKVAGNIMLAQKLAPLLKTEAKL